MSVNVDLFGNIISPPASPKKDAKPIYTPPATDAQPTDAQSDRAITVETLGMSPNYISTYETFLAGPNLNSIATADVNFQDRFHDCKMSDTAVKTIKKCTQIICYISSKEYYQSEIKELLAEHPEMKYKDVAREAYRNVKGYFDEEQEKKIDGKHLCTFVTLTLPAAQKHTDRQICDQLLNPFLVWARKRKKVKYYVWKKELQSNGNLHFHIVWDRTVAWQDIRAEWNKLCNKGKVKGIKQPFDYVTRYHDKWSKVHANGFNREYVQDYVSKLPSTEEVIQERMQDCAQDLTAAEYNELRRNIIDGIVGQYYKAYKNELDRQLHSKTPYEIYSDPNSTDIKAVNSPQQVAYYLSKYIAKEIENNPALADYQSNVDQYKKAMSEWRKAAEANRRDGIDDADQMECWRLKKDELDEYRRKNSPIKGRMWFKSQSLSVFLHGIPHTNEDGKTSYIRATQEIDDNYLLELCDLEKYLHQEESRINKERLQKAKHAEAAGDAEKAAKLKEPVQLVLDRYEMTSTNAVLAEKAALAAVDGIVELAEVIKEPIRTVFDDYMCKINLNMLAEKAAIAAADGDPNAQYLMPPILAVLQQDAKIICKTLCINVFDLQHLNNTDNNPRFPLLSRLWYRYIKAGLKYNRKEKI